MFAGSRLLLPVSTNFVTLVRKPGRKGDVFCTKRGAKLHKSLNNSRGLNGAQRNCFREPGCGAHDGQHILVTTFGFR